MIACGRYDMPIVKKTKTGYKVVNKYTGKTLMTTKSRTKAYARKNKGY